MKVTSLPVCLLVALAFLPPDAAAQCGCGPVFNAAATPRSYRFDVSVGDTLAGLVRAAADKWNGVMSGVSNGSMNPGNGDIVIKFTAELDDSQYVPSTKTLYIERHVIDPADHPERAPYSNEFIQALFLHEFGHPLGWDQAPQGCSSSVMANTLYTSYRADFTDCDRQSIEYYYPQGGGICDPTGQQEYECEWQTVLYWWNPATCQCENRPGSPILIALSSASLRVTSVEEGVVFDLDSDGTPERRAWTLPGASTAFLAWDRNGNGEIDDGRELFGDSSAQLGSANRNGFAALAELDRTDLGGNGDGVCDGQDQLYAQLRLWIDANHDGKSQPDELHLLSEYGIRGLSLHYEWVGRRDASGNYFRYKSKILSAATVANWAWDVFLATSVQ